MNRADRRAQARAKPVAPRFLHKRLSRLVSQEHMQHMQKPITRESLLRQLIQANASLSDIRTGKGIEQQLHDLWVVAHLCRALAQMGFGDAEVVQSAEDASDAIAGVQGRFKDIGKVVMTGPEFTAIHAMLVLYGKQIELEGKERVSLGDFVEARRRVIAHIKALQVENQQHMEGMKQ